MVLSIFFSIYILLLMNKEVIYNRLVFYCAWAVIKLCMQKKNLQKNGAMQINIINIDKKIHNEYTKNSISSLSLPLDRYVGFHRSWSSNLVLLFLSMSGIFCFLTLSSFSPIANIFIVLQMCGGLHMVPEFYNIIHTKNSQIRRCQSYLFLQVERIFSRIQKIQFYP